MSARRALAGLACALLLAGAGAGRACAHELTPALLSIVERGGDVYDVLWRVPIDEAPRALLRPVLPAAAQAPGASHAVSSDSQARYESWQARIAGGLAGREVGLDGPAGAASDALVRIAFLDGRVVHGRLVPAGSPFIVPAAPGRLDTAATYLRLGVEHILLGFDHLLFVLGLLLLSRSLGALVRTVTAFTAAHSVTLALAALGVLHVAQAPAEAVIALSIVFVAREIAVGDGRFPTLAARRPWVVAALFGLIHGLGFAGALAAIGLPAGEVPLALAAFNAGVELGQLAFVVAVLVAASALLAAAAAPWRRGDRAEAVAAPSLSLVAGPARVALGYGIGAVATALCIGRVAIILRP